MERGRIDTYQGRRLANPDEDIFDQGLAFDLNTLFDRRRVLKLFGVIGVAAGLALVGCGSSTDGSAGLPSGTASSGAVTGEDCATIPEETAGPYPADGSNGPDVLSQSGIVRADIRSSFGEFSGTADGGSPHDQTRYPEHGMCARPWKRGGLPLAMQPRRELLDLHGRTRTTCAACRRPTRTAS
jgi:hypothetical protein